MLALFPTIKSTDFIHFLIEDLEFHVLKLIPLSPANFITRTSPLNNGELLSMAYNQALMWLLIFWDHTAP
jgi:hypothetical protein